MAILKNELSFGPTAIPGCASAGSMNPNVGIALRQPNPDKVDAIPQDFQGDGQNILNPKTP
ncbi:hypothetical protein GGD83_003285 [Rhodoblastus sphagnicola]|uniref:hypothetical protein n=1 Tax=Rhodoblastus sphagnicola TaxID=333368 RepID=UPI0011B02336|nr:hypothetical protein [Rhodoblastus sphagnicola]MBB4199469.1 hypothetical protein [Rhodoblastus sphagnicola]